MGKSADIRQGLGWKSKVSRETWRKEKRGETGRHAKKS